MDNANVRDPREHVNEEPRDDLGDLMMGAVGMSAFMIIVFAAAVVIKYLIS
ncbi:YqzM family protein [Paenibacillus beijingensis]|uniref:YqzM family protein n=1 Tax=Paenibacillus beijingensis TaxID=1126833 RepID=UPI000B01139C|nr:YqzM family protein [Paenibacillus beijingensis]